MGLRWATRSVGAIAALVAMVGAPGGLAFSSAPRENIACPVRGPQRVSANPWEQAHHSMAPAGASPIVLCRYAGRGAHPPLKLIGSLVLLHGKFKRELIADYNALKPIRGVPPPFCPADNGSEVVAHLFYKGGHRVEIATRLRGCQPVTNGDINRLAANIDGKNPAGPRLIALLKYLTPRFHK